MSPTPDVLLSMRNAYEDKTDSASFVVPKLINKNRNSSKKNSEKIAYRAIELDSDAITSSEKESFTFYGALTTDAAWHKEQPDLPEEQADADLTYELPGNNDMTVEE